LVARSGMKGEELGALNTQVKTLWDALREGGG